MEEAREGVEIIDGWYDRLGVGRILLDLASE
jgi:hypothetical protein